MLDSNQIYFKLIFFFVFQLNLRLYSKKGFDVSEGTAYLLAYDSTDFKKVFILKGKYWEGKSREII